MKSTLIAVVAACLAMLATSGIVALATAAPSTSLTTEANGTTTTVVEDYISSFIDEQYRAVLARQVVDVSSAATTR